MSQTPSAIPAFDFMPEVIALGKDTLQQLADEWLQGSVAMKHGVKRVAIRDGGGRPVIEDIAIEVAHDPTSPSLDPHTAHFPVDDLVRYIIDRGVAQPEARLKLKQIVRARRDKAGEAYQRYKSKPAQRLFIRCKNSGCQSVFETQYSILPGQKWGGHFEPFDCPSCGFTSPVTPEDFFTLNAPEERPVNLKGPSGEDEKWFSILIPWRANVFPVIAPLVGRINAAAFEGHEPETVLFLGPQGSSSLPWGRLYFAFRDQSFNKMFRRDTQRWEEVRHVATNKTLYEVADFNQLAAIKREAGIGGGGVQ